MPPLLPVDDAIRRILEGVSPVAPEQVSITQADGRVLAEPLIAQRTQPPFDASAMDGYAVRTADAANAGAVLRLIGASAAGKRFPGRVGPGEAVRIFTGAPVPDGADGILIQENASADGDRITTTAPVEAGRHVRRAGYDFRAGDAGMAAGSDIGMRELALAAAFGYGTLAVRRRPKVAILATGDELVPPGTVPGPDQIVATNALAIAAYVHARGGVVDDRGIVRDDLAATSAAIAAAESDRPDVLVTIGGASVGDHDLVRPALSARGIDVDFWRVAMRPGKPLMFGRTDVPGGGTLRVLGLPGNPASSIVCTLVFLAPLLDALLGRPTRDLTNEAVLGSAVPANDERRDYVRARLTRRPELPPVATPLPRQDSGMLSAMAQANCLLIRPPNAAAAAVGEPCRILPLP